MREENIKKGTWTGGRTRNVENKNKLGNIKYIKF